jgi:Zn-dependent protease with chaperone function
MHPIKKTLKQSAIAALIITVIATAFNLYETVPIKEIMKMAFIVFLVWLVLIFFLLLLIRNRKS